VGRRFQIAIVAVVAFLLIAAIGAYAYDSSRSDQIAEGVTIGGVDVSGLTADEARELVDRELVDPLRDHVTARFEGVEYRISPGELEIRSDVDAMVDTALEESQEGGLPGRLWRYATGGEVDTAISPQISYSNDALDEFVAEVVADVNRDPVDASIEPSVASLNKVEGQDGVAVQEDELRSNLEQVVQSPDERRVSIPVERVKPEVTTDELAERYPTYLTVDRSNFQLHLWKELELVKTYTIAVGAVGFDTPVGVYNIQNMAVDPAWSVPNADWAGDLAGTVVPGGVPENPLKERWMGIYDGAGIHGTDATYSLGTAASHGCIRMSIPDVIELYDQVDVGTPIYIG
jgi:L,D-transpeptidase catalytic domain/Putative peptidoglycan binding domain